GGVRDRRDEMNLDAFIQQSDEYRDAGGLSAYYRFMSNLGNTHPFPVVRVAELRNWVDDGTYTEIMNGNYHRVGEPRPFQDDATAAAKTFGENATKVFQDTERYVNQALLDFIDATQRRFGGRTGDQ
ncbi:MAG: hypothetical protein AAF531_15615, partial [Actinomycetota bacterium]